jgi:alkanesulfonate monooxygenase SsuD/methylene tetrahydromethanopterin reductase-like flavin-dependent oxidoreductase (luciferase family)
MTAPKRDLAPGNRLKLGLFSANCSGGLAVTKAPERWRASWDDNKSLAIMADRAGLDFLLPIARWRGYGGEGDFQGSSLDTIAWAAGLLAVTERITVLSTVHTAFTHPVAAAKQFATIDQIGQGRFGVNVVCGWNEPEYRLFGLDLPREHRDRYAYGQEWLDIVRKLWRDETPFDWHGTYFHLEQATGEPRPWGGSEPIIFNAAASLEGREFAVRNSDVLLTSLVDLGKTREEVATLKDLARAGHGRAVEVIGVSYVVCRPTLREALDYHRYYAEEMADEGAVDRLMTLLGQHAKSFTAEELRQHRIRFAGGHGTYPLIGSPDAIADALERISATGLSGTTIAFVNYSDELPYFRDEVLPRLERRGLRLPIQR